MKIINKNKDKISKNYFKKFLLIYFIFSLIILAIFASIFVSSYKFKKFVQQNKLYLFKAGRFEYLYFPNIIFKSTESILKNVEELNLNISFKNVLKIEESRTKAINQNNLTEDLRKTVNVEVINLEKRNKVKGKIRLKGDRNIHWKDKKYSSYRIELQKDKYIMGMNKFSIQKPRVRNYVHEWIYHKMIGEEKLINLKYKFIKLKINGKNQGLYTVEESFDKQLIERNRRRNGPIFGLDEDLSWMRGEKPIFEIYNKKFWSKKENYKLINISSKIINNFFNNQTNELVNFDLHKWATFFAISDLLYTYHGIAPKSVKFYFNPVSRLVEPIPFDGHRLHPNYYDGNLDFDKRILVELIFDKTNEKSMNWVKSFFIKNDGTPNYDFLLLYLEALKKISSDNYLNKFFDKHNNKIKFINSLIYKDYFYYDNLLSFGPGIYYFKKKDIYLRAKHIREKISKKIKLDISQNTNKINFKYNTLIPIKVVSLQCENKKEELYELFFSKNIILSNLDISNSSIIIDGLLKKEIFEIDKFDNKYTRCLSVKFQNLYNKKYFEKNLNISGKITNEISFNKGSVENKYLEYFMNIENNLFLKDDLIIIDKNIEIPKNFNVIINEGQKIILKNNAFIISNSPWTAKGSQEKIIRIEGLKNNFGGGIFIKNSKQKSLFKNIEFRYLSGLKKSINNEYNNKVLTSITFMDENNIFKEKQSLIEKNESNLSDEYLIYGALNFYNVNLNLENLNINNINSEDAINIINSEFELKNTNFQNIFSDAVDVDFSKGKILNLGFKNIKNDALDFSGSNVTVKKIKFRNVSDKMISIGENSFVEINEIVGSDGFIGVASKDGSQVNLTNAKLKNVKYPYTAYIKKNEYEPSILSLKNIQLDKNNNNFYSDGISKILHKNISNLIINEDIVKIFY